MSAESWIFLGVFVLCSFSCLRGLQAVWSSLKFLRRIARAVRAAPGLRDASGRFKYQPSVALIMPCCGIDECLQRTVERLGRQDYGPFEIIFTFESADDPAYPAVGRWTADWSSPRTRRVVAGLTERRSQKIHNLLAAVAAVPPEREVLVFLDSDAVPNDDWLGHLVAPLQDEQVGASTGFRWYTAAGGLANGVRSLWNAAGVSLMEEKHLAFCWGGATAIRRQRFDAFEIARRWDCALSDDLQVTLAVRESGREIRFVPQALIPSHDQTTFKGFWEFAKRQLIITRICAPAIWRAGFVFCGHLVVGGTLSVVLFFGALLGWFGNPIVMYAGLAAWLLILGSATAKAALRQLALRKVLRPPDMTWLDAWWDIGGAAFSGMLHIALFFASMRTRRLLWRNTYYELVSPSETRVLGRAPAAPAAERQPAGNP